MISTIPRIMDKWIDQHFPIFTKENPSIYAAMIKKNFKQLLKIFWISFDFINFVEAD